MFMICGKFQKTLLRFIWLHDQEVAINLNDALAYHNRGILRIDKLNDRPGGIADLRQVARLARAQKQTQLLQTILGILNQLGATE